MPDRRQADGPRDVQQHTAAQTKQPFTRRHLQPSAAQPLQQHQSDADAKTRSDENMRDRHARDAERLVQRRRGAPEKPEAEHEQDLRKAGHRGGGP